MCPVVPCGQTDMKLIVVFRNLANSPKSSEFSFVVIQQTMTSYSFTAEFKVLDTQHHRGVQVFFFNSRPHRHTSAFCGHHEFYTITHNQCDQEIHKTLHSKLYCLVLRHEAENDMKLHIPRGKATAQNVVQKNMMA